VPIFEWRRPGNRPAPAATRESHWLSNESRQRHFGSHSVEIPACHFASAKADRHAMKIAFRFDDHPVANHVSRRSCLSLLAESLTSNQTVCQAQPNAGRDIVLTLSRTWS